MIITRKSIFTGIERSLDLNINEEDLNRWLKGEDLIQNIFPHLTDNEREFILSGTTPEEWDEFTTDEDDK